ncbi:basic proline-rich protein [Streptomyces himastatinicus ATCC 53653]|uniref:Basic proline-rich protein n=1 Tax=Streptomyces himastatinicus ATCC 53653 TaxID=457427 RepID=D9W6M2_9ACTN|nr:basic proline-rich protein [Streptomyces himastatinicus ATCC 53653]
MHLLDLLAARAEPAAAVLLTVTRRCPLACAHCSTASSMGSEQIDAAVLKRFVGTFTPADRPEYVLLTGGEPLLRPRLVAEIAERVRDVGGRTQLLSGMYFAAHGRTPAPVRHAIDAVDHFAASIDAFHEREVPRAAVLRVLRRLVDEGKDVSVQLTGRTPDDPYLREAAEDIRGELDDRVPILVTVVKPAGRARTWLPEPGVGAASGSGVVPESGPAARYGSGAAPGAGSALEGGAASGAGAGCEAVSGPGALRAGAVPGPGSGAAPGAAATSGSGPGSGPVPRPADTPTSGLAPRPAAGAAPAPGSGAAPGIGGTPRYGPAPRYGSVPEAAAMPGSGVAPGAGSALEGGAASGAGAGSETVSGSGAALRAGGVPEPESGAVPGFGPASDDGASAGTGTGTGSDTVSGAGTRHRGTVPAPCVLAAWPVVCFDGTVVTCCNQDVVDAAALGRVPAHLRLGHIAHDGWAAIRERLLERELLCGIRAFGPRHLASLAGAECDGYCAACVTALGEPRTAARATEVLERPGVRAVERRLAGLTREGGAETFLRRYGTEGYRELAALGRHADGAP